MKILQVHNYYRQAGGEDRVFESECQLLKCHGHEVVRYTAYNEALKEVPAISAGVRTIWNHTTYKTVRRLLRREQPDVVHAHNTFPVISPALHHAAAAQGIPLVQTLHNYRLLCAGATLYRDGQVCQDCMHSVTPWPAIKYACYRNNRLATAATGIMILAHRSAGTWKDKVRTYIALTNFSKQKFVEGGLPAERVAIKPNFLASDPGTGPGGGGYALFAGRLVKEKGILTLLRAWENVPGIPLKIAGSGPLRSFVEESARALQHIEYLGACDHAAIMELLKQARLLVFPSEWYEGLPMSIVESFACGTPVLAARLGSMCELIEDGVNGRLFRPGDTASLIACAKSLFQTGDTMRRAARACYEQTYTPERNYKLLMDIYRNARRAA